MTSKDPESVPEGLHLLDLEIEELLSLFLGVTSAKTLEYLGVSLKDGKSVEKDLVKASLAIDCTSFFVDKLTPFLSDEEVKNLQKMLSELQINYVRAS